MSRMPCRACRTCIGNALRELQDEGWTVGSDGKWRKPIGKEEAHAIIDAQHRGTPPAKRIEIVTDAAGTRYFLLMGES